MPNTTRSPRIRALSALCAFALLTAACGDDDDEATTEDTLAEGEAASGDGFDEYCAATAELDEQDGPPTVEQMERLKELAPEGISSEVELVADALIEADGDVGAAFADPAVEENLGAIEDWESENCDAGGELAVAPELQEYCDFVEELDSQDGPPTEEQLLHIKEIRPEAVGEDTDMVADAFIAADGDFGAVFSDPEIEAAFERMEAHDAEACGFEGSDDEEEEAATEPLEGAEIVEVTAVDFAFEGIPDTVPAGDVSFHMTNDGEAAHEMFMARLGQGVDLDELLAAEEEPSPEEAQEVGGTFAAPGQSAYLNAEDLEPGTYAVVCFIPGPEGKSHHELGMKTTFTVA